MENNNMTPEIFNVSYFSKAWELTADNFRKLCLDRIYKGCLNELTKYGQALSQEQSDEVIGNDDAICLNNFTIEDAVWYMEFHNWRFED
jgi:hypothetical protein